MVKRIKKKVRARRPKQAAGLPTWVVPFDEEGRAGVYIHKHEESDDHTSCGPVVACCEKAIAPYEALCPDLVGEVSEWKRQPATHLMSWFDDGVAAMYFALCDPTNPAAVYMFGLPAEDARRLLGGRVSHDHYRQAQSRHVADDA